MSSPALVATLAAADTPNAPVDSDATMESNITTADASTPTTTATTVNSRSNDSSLPIRLEQLHYDTIVIGTGLSSAILSAALSKSGQTVLHLDENEYYGSRMTSMNWKDFNNWLHSFKTNPEPDAKHNVDEWNQLKNKTLEQLAQAQLSTDSENNAPSTTQSATSGSSNDSQFIPFLRHTSSNHFENGSVWELKKQSEESSSSISTSDPEGGLGDQTSSLTIPDFNKSSRNFSIDVMPHLIFARTEMVDLLIQSDVASYIEFKPVDTSYLVYSAQSLNNSNAQEVSSNISSNIQSLTSPSSDNLTFQRIPVSKSDLFSDSFLSFQEKRKLMKLMSAVLGEDYKLSAEANEQVGNELQQWADRPFSEFLASREFSPRLLLVIQYAIAFLPVPLTMESFPSSSNTSLNIITSNGVALLKRYFHSIGRYSNGAFLYPLYGTGELSQAFARLSAVNGTTFILRCSATAFNCENTTITDVNAVTSDETKPTTVRGVILASQYLTCNSIVAEPQYLPEEVLKTQQELSKPFAHSSYAYCILDDPLSNSEHFHSTIKSRTDPDSSIITDVNLYIFPPFAIGNPSTIYALESGPYSRSTPNGYYALYLSTVTKDDGSNAETELQNAIAALCHTERLVSSSTNSLVRNTLTAPASKSAANVLWAGFYQIRALTLALSSTNSKFSNLHTIVDPSLLFTVDDAIQTAKTVFHRIMPSISFETAMKRERPTSTTDDAELLDDLGELNSLDDVLAGL